jgi:WD40 repeat protein
MGLPTATRQIAVPWRELPTHGDSVTDAAWSPGGDHIASIGRDRRLKIHRLSTNTIVHEHQFTFPLMHVDFLDDETLVLCDFASNLRAYSWNDAKVLSTLNMNVERSTAMAVAPAASLAALGYKTGLVEFAEYRAGKSALSMDTLSVLGPVWQMKWSSSADTLYVSSIREGCRFSITGAAIFSTAFRVQALLQYRKRGGCSRHHSLAAAYMYIASILASALRL